MLSNTIIKSLRKLKTKKYRMESGLFCVEGEKIVGEALLSGISIDTLIGEQEWIQSNSRLINNAKVKKVITTNIGGLKSISNLETPNKVIAVCHSIQNKLKVPALKDKLALVLDNIQEPGNLGTIIRLAEWFGVNDIICSHNTVELYNPKVIQSAMGSVFRVKLFYLLLPDFLEEYKICNSNPVFGTFIDGESIYDADLTHHGLIIMGNESKGISKELLPYISKKVSIPSFSANKHYPNSLNVSAAAAVICSEFRRRREYHSK